MKKTSKGNPLDQIEQTLNEYLVKKAPALPSNIKELIVKLAPYLVILTLIAGIPAIIALIGVGSIATMMAPYGEMQNISAVHAFWGTLVAILLFVPVLVLEAMSVKGLFARKAKAWKYLYWAQLISIFSDVVRFNLFGALLSFVIGFYFLFQIRSYYK